MEIIIWPRPILHLRILGNEKGCNCHQSLSRNRFGLARCTNLIRADSICESQWSFLDDCGAFPQTSLLPYSTILLFSSNNSSFLIWVEPLSKVVSNCSVLIFEVSSPLSAKPTRSLNIGSFLWCPTICLLSR